MIDKTKMDLLMYSMLVSMNGSLKSHEITPEDVEYFSDSNVAECQTELYIKVIEMLNKGMEYEKILQFIDELDLETYKNLNSVKRTYIKKKLIKDVNTRKNNEMKKNKGDVSYE